MTDAIQADEAAQQEGQKLYKSPSGKKYTIKQVKLYYAGGGKFPGEK